MAKNIKVRVTTEALVGSNAWDHDMAQTASNFCTLLCTLIEKRYPDAQVDVQWGDDDIVRPYGDWPELEAIDAVEEIGALSEQVFYGHHGEWLVERS